MKTPQIAPLPGFAPLGVKRQPLFRFTKTFTREVSGFKVGDTHTETMRFVDEAHAAKWASSINGHPAVPYRVSFPVEVLS